MLQILLAFLAISIVSVSGYGLIEQMSLQTAMQDQRENLRRLDVAADSIQGHLVAMPGLSGVFSPAGFAGTYGQMPVGMGGINATVSGVAFAYCPIASFAGTANGSVPLSGGGNYDVEVRNNVVVGSSLSLATGMSGFKPVAYILAAGRGNSLPPSCASVVLRNGRPYVSGGLVRVVSLPSGALVSGTIAQNVSDMWVADVSGASRGDGRSSLTPASIDDAVRHWLTFRPAAMTIHIVGSVSMANPSLWNDFVSTIGSSPTRLVFDGGTLNVPTGGSGIFPTPASLTLNNMTVTDVRFAVGQGDELNISGTALVSAGVCSGSADICASGVHVAQGGRLNVNGGSLKVVGAVDSAVSSYGEIVMSGGASISGTQETQSTIVMLPGGRFTGRNGGVIGDTGARSLTSGIVSAGASSISSDGSINVAMSSASSCWASGVNDVTFTYSANGSGAGSVVGPDPAFVGITNPADSAQQQAYQAYRAAVEARNRARETNRSSFTCI